MPETYLSLTKREQAQILQSIAINSGMAKTSLVLEKDIWICWALEHLFKMPNQLPMAFKGGTSLSKAYKVIDRFSEDVDITIDYRAFDCGNPFADGISNTKIKDISLKLKAEVTRYIKQTIIPYFEKIIVEQFDQQQPIVTLDKDGETLYLSYPSVIEQKSGYIIDAVRLEFGGRNISMPNDVCTIETDISEYMENLLFPSAKVIVLSPEKTFWEKITLIHYECNRLVLKEDANRISRHWYDISKLANHEIGSKAQNNKELLKEVIKIKKIFYNSSFAKYDDCLNGKLCLIPETVSLLKLKKDFEKMVSSGMFYNKNPEFDEIINVVHALEEKINTMIF